MDKYQSEQENFWAGTFGDQYVKRNRGAGLLASNLNFFSKALSQAGKPGSLIEFGANIGMNLQAIKLHYPEIDLLGLEINEQAARELRSLLGAAQVFEGSIFEYESNTRYDLSLMKGVLIHIKPEMLPQAYKALYEASRKFILIGEYYNPSPVVINYRGHTDKLFKRDFAGEMMEQYPDLRLVDYGFCYRRDPAFPQDDITWFLLKKEAD